MPENGKSRQIKQIPGRAPEYDVGPQTAVQPLAPLAEIPGSEIAELSALPITVRAFWTSENLTQIAVRITAGAPRSRRGHTGAGIPDAPASARPNHVGKHEKRGASAKPKNV